MWLTKVKLSAAVLLAIGTLVAGAGALARQETAPRRKEHVEPQTPNAPLAKHPDNTAAGLDQVARDFDAVTEQFIRQLRGTIAVLDPQANPDHGKLAEHLFEQLNRVEAEFRRAQDRLAGPSRPDFAHAPTPKAVQGKGPKVSRAAKSPDRPAAVREPLDESGAEGERAPGAHQATLRAGGYIFTASPTGSRAIAYDPKTREVKSVQLNATKEQPLKVTARTAQAVDLVALRLEGSNITRIAVFDLKADKWLPVDLDEPVSGDVGPEYVGHGGTAYDLGPHHYTFSLTTGAWDHLDIRTLGDDAGNEGRAKVPARGKAGE